MVARVSSTLKVVWVRTTTRSGSGTSTVRGSARRGSLPTWVCTATRMVLSGASP